MTRKGVYSNLNNTLRLLLWNINGRTGKNEYVVPVRLILDQIEKNRRPEIVVLTELVKYALGYCELKDAFQEMGYDVFCSEFDKSQNQVLIAIKLTISSSIKSGSLSKYLGKKCSNHESDFEDFSIEEIKIVPDYLNVNFYIFNKCVSLIACRIKTGGVDSMKVNYDHEAVQFYETIIPEIEEIDSDCVIVCGDFNNGRYKRTLKEKFDDVKDAYRGCAHYNFNLHRVRDALVNDSFVMVDNAKPTHRIFSDDHIFVKGVKSALCGNPDWTFISLKNGYVYSEESEWKKDGYKDIVGLPDHAILLASIEL